MADISNKTIEIRNGLVGIGTTSPTQLLHVQGNFRLSGGFYDNFNSSGSTNQVLISTGTGIAWTTSTATGILTGSGTINTLSKFSSANSLVDSNVSDNGTIVNINSILNVTGISTFARDVSINGIIAGIGPGTSLTNTSFGSSANLSNITGTNNVAIGYQALLSNKQGINNIAIGVSALRELDGGFGNGSGNIGIGFSALGLHTSGSFNLAIGQGAMAGDRNGVLNVAVGFNAMNFNSSGRFNTVVGAQAAVYTDAGEGNVAVGYFALRNYVGIGSQVAIGFNALQGNTANRALNTGTTNLAVGYEAGAGNTSGSNNLFVGFRAGFANTSGSNNIYFGNRTDGNTTGNYQIALGNDVILNASNQGGWGGATNATRTNLGIGTFTSLARLHVETLAAGNMGLYIAGSPSQTGDFVEINATTNGQNYFTITGIGSVGIYTTIPTTALDVSGVITGRADAVINSITVGRGGGNVAGNTLIGAGGALANNTSGALNAAFGWSALGFNTTGGSNSAFGYDAGVYNRASQNTIMGARALSGTATTGNFGNNNTVIGFAAGRYISSSDNTAIGQGALTGDSTNFATGTGQNVAIGKDSMSLNQTGNTNTAVGRQSLYANTTGNGNVAIGNNTLFSTTTANQNTAIGAQAMFYQTTQGTQVAVGYNALAGNSTTALNNGQLNTALGYNAGAANTSGSFNVFVGHNAGAANTSGSSNTFVGSYAGQNNTTGINNTFVGSTAGGNNRSGINNTVIGLSAANQLTTGSSNCYLGRQAAYYNLSGNDNIAIGENGLFYFEASSNQIAIGRNALFGNASRALNTGINNVAIGYGAGLAVTSGIGNVYIGHLAGDTITSGVSNIIIGNQADGTATASYQIALGELVIPTASNFGAWGGNTNSTRTELGVGTFSPQARVHIETLAAGNRGLYIAGSASQTSNLIEIDATTNGSPLFIVSGIGSVGINTGDTPRFLYVQGDTRLNGPVGIVGDPVAGYPLSVSGSIFLTQGSVLSWSAGNADIQSGSGSAFDMRFRTFSGSFARENMRIMSNGNVGIGTSGPFAKLHIQGVAATNTPLILSGFGTPTVDLLRIEQNLGGTRYITVDAIGELGIGTSSPTQALHVQLNSRFNGAIFDVNNLPGAPIGIVSQALFSTGTGVTWAPVKRNLVVPLMTAFNPTQVGIDSAIFIVPQDPINGTSSMTFSFRRVNVRVETPSAAGITTINIAKSTGTGQFVGTSILSANINLTGAATYEASGTSFAVGYTTASSGDKLAINFVGVNTFHQNLTVELIAIEA